MDKETLKKRIGYCGLLCALCREDGSCKCRSENCCGKRSTPEGCYQYECCRKKGISGCWECQDAPCGIDVLGTDKIKTRAFIRCIKEEGIDTFCNLIIQNINNDIKYHRTGIWGKEPIRGDYDLPTEESVIELLHISNRK